MSKQTEEQKTYSLEEVKSVVNELNEAKKIEQEQARLQSFISEIEEKVESLEKADAENKETIEALHQAISDKEADLEKAGEEMAKLQQQLESTQAELEAATQKIAQAEERELLSARIQTLTDKELLRSNEEAQVKQIEKVKAMSEEEFAAYVEDLDDIRNQTLASNKDVKEAPKKEDSQTEDDVQLEKVAEQLAEEVANHQAENSEEASKLIRELIAKAKGKTSSEKANATNADTQSEEVSPQNFESAATVRTVQGGRFAALGQGFAERLQTKK